MIFTTLAAALALPVALAQYGGPPPPSSGSSTAAAQVAVPSAPANTTGHINIDVSPGSAFTFSVPDLQNVSVGTQITFFFPQSSVGPHSVTQSSFEAPCTYLEANATTQAPAGFDSGLVQAVQFTINVTSTDPIWYHCKQLNHCGMGMVGAINAPTTGPNTFDAFMAAAVKQNGNETPQTTGGPVLGGFGASAIATPAATATATAAVSSATMNFASTFAVLFGVAVSVIFV